MVIHWDRITANAHGLSETHLRRVADANRIPTHNVPKLRDIRNVDLTNGAMTVIGEW